MLTGDRSSWKPRSHKIQKSGSSCPCVIELHLVTVNGITLAAIYQIPPEEILNLKFLNKVIILKVHVVNVNTMALFQLLYTIRQNLKAQALKQVHNAIVSLSCM